ncbi:hypothetical protein FQN57_001128 [Myotisia sp. PD_48]|nr:hypothetical protein FQN57_001128 [Myotisia sp. PD_48]
MDSDLSPVKKSSESPPPSASAEDSCSKNAPTPKTKGPRKRTKTGCLTCRKRRIKCGEEKPRCNNCIKSKRECEGYGQRVVFRQPVGPIPHLGTIRPIQSLSGIGAMPMMASSFVHSVQHVETSSMRPPLLPIAPRPSYHAISENMPKQEYSSPDFNSLASTPTHRPSHGHYSWDQIHYNPSAYLPTQPIPNPPYIDTSTTQQPYSQDIYAYDDSMGCQEGIQLQAYEAAAVYQSQLASHFQGFNPPSSLTGNTPEYVQQAGVSTSSLHSKESKNSLGHSKQQDVMYDAAEESDEYYDVESDEEMGAPVSSGQQPIKPSKPPFEVRLSHPPFSTYANHDNILASYHPSPMTSPLVDPEAAQLFSYFMTYVGGTISSFERHPIAPPVMSSQFHIPVEQQSLFTHTLPTIAFEHHGLSQAILALSSHHLAKMNNQAPTAAFRHYHYALRKLSKAVGIPHRRKHIGTLAATLLLGYFEVLGAEHTKWSSHLAGATQLIRDIDFIGMTRDIRAMRTRARAEQAFLVSQGNWSITGILRYGTFFENDAFAPIESCIDTEMISTIMGRAVNYDEVGEVVNEDGQSNPPRELTAKDIDDFRIKSDLYWWYCKQDLFQCMISGNPLLQTYDKWGQSPPRAPIGKIDTIYGTMDHLLLLLARICTFGVKDRKRKLKAIEENGGEWRPPPGMFPPGMRGGPPKGVPKRPPPDNLAGAKSAKHPKSNPNPESSPPMYGMLPQQGPVRLFPGFADSKSHPPAPSPPSSDDGDLDAQTAAAETEWGNIVSACEAFEKALGPAFVPLPPDGAPVILTPFGPALQYRTLAIGCIWAFYYTARIILHRFHPSMPPSAMIAAGVAAPRTAQYAQFVGRITGGIPYESNDHFARTNLVNPTIAGVLNELIVALFFSGVQYVDAAQRDWTVTKLRDIARITGGSSPTAVAHGCETSWIKTFEAGRGPPYQRTLDTNLVRSVGREGCVSDNRADNRRWVAVKRSDPLLWAMGLLSVDDDYKN